MSHDQRFVLRVEDMRRIGKIGRHSVIVKSVPFLAHLRARQRRQDVNLHQGVPCPLEIEHHPQAVAQVFGLLVREADDHRGGHLKPEFGGALDHLDGLLYVQFLVDHLLHAL